MGKVFKWLGIGCFVIMLLTCGGIFAGFKWVQGVAKTPKPPDPKIGKYAALRPVFRKRGGGSYAAGTAVAVKVRPDAPPIILTAQHLFGPMGGLDAPVPPSKLNQHILSVGLVPFGGEKPVAVASGSIRKAGEFPDEDLDDVSGDVAAFRLPPKSRVNALDLAPGNPSMGEWIWLVGDVVDHEPQAQRLFPGRVIIVSDKKTLVTFQEHFNLQAFSGAPLINAKKQVVGLLIGGGPGAGIINPAGSIRKRLEESGVKF